MNSRPHDVREYQTTARQRLAVTALAALGRPESDGEAAWKLWCDLLPQERQRALETIVAARGENEVDQRPIAMVAPHVWPSDAPEPFAGVEVTPKLGSVSGKCQLCTCDVWIGPEQQKLIELNDVSVICIVCMAKNQQAEQMSMLTLSDTTHDYGVDLPSEAS